MCGILIQSVRAYIFENIIHPGRKEGRKEGCQRRKEGRESKKEGTNEGRNPKKEGRKEGRDE